LDFAVGAIVDIVGAILDIVGAAILEVEGAAIVDIVGAILDIVGTAILDIVGAIFDFVGALFSKMSVHSSVAPPSESEAIVPVTVTQNWLFSGLIQIDKT
jgi:hypothetical protein